MSLGGRRWLALLALAALIVAAVLLLPRPVAALAGVAAVVAGALLARTFPAPREPLPPPLGDPQPAALAGVVAPSDLLPLLDPLANGVLLLDDELVVLAANQALARIVDQPLEAMVGASLIRATRDIELVAVARERPAEPREAHLTGGDEVLISAAPVDLSLTPGRATLLIAVEDVTALRAAQRARSDLVANLSHELRTPLAGARAIAETFQSAAEDPVERARFLALLSDEIERMSGLVERMLRLAQIESEHEPLELEPLATAELLDEAAARATPLASRRGIRVEVDEVIATPVAGSRDRVGEVLASLLDNALRHSPDGSRIVLAALPDDGGVRFEVRDEGPGILPSERERIFERFYTGDDAREAGGGTGLGLAIARQLVQQQGGHIWVADRTPGATFCFSLALASEAVSDS